MNLIVIFTGPIYDQNSICIPAACLHTNLVPLEISRDTHDFPTGLADMTYDLQENCIFLE